VVTLMRPQGVKGFVLQPCDLICEPASPALSEARERQVAKSAAVINPSRLHPTLRCAGTLCDRRSSSPVGANIYFTSLIASTLLESRVYYTSGGIFTATHTLLSMLYLSCTWLVLFCSLIAAFVIEGFIGVTGGQSGRTTAFCGCFGHRNGGCRSPAAFAA
jgi:hypothetical protein